MGTIDEEDQTWRHHGACCDADPAIFYPTVNFGPKPSPEAIEALERAAAYCKVCDVYAPCHAWALAHETEGIWAATTPEQRRRLRKALGIKTQPILIDFTYLLNPPPSDDELPLPEPPDEDREATLDDIDYDEDLYP